MRTIDSRASVPIQAAPRLAAPVVLLVLLLAAAAGTANATGVAHVGAAATGRQAQPMSVGNATRAAFDEERVLVRVTPVGASQAIDFFTSDLRILAHLDESPVEASVISAQADVIHVRIDTDGEEQYELKSLDGSETGIRVGERVELAAVPTEVPAASHPLTPGSTPVGDRCR